MRRRRSATSKVLLVALAAVLTVAIPLVINIVTPTAPGFLAEHPRLSWAILGMLTLLSILIGVRLFLLQQSPSDHLQVHSTVRKDLGAMISTVVVGAESEYVVGAPSSDLPPAPRPFVGRRRDFEWMIDTLSPNRQPATGAIVALYGKPGAGKSALALHVADHLDKTHQLRVLYINLAGSTERPLTASEAMNELLLILGANVHGLPKDLHARARLYRRLANCVPTLVVLDNAIDEQAPDLLIPGNRALAIVTSRAPLARLGPARPRRLDLMSEEEALSLLKAVSGKSLAGHNPALVELAHLAGRLPLALAVVGALLREREDLTPQQLAQELREERVRLHRMRVKENPEVRAAIAVSYASLSESSASLYRRWGLFNTAQLPAPVLHALHGGVPAAASDTVGCLMKAQLLDFLGQGRYGMHDLFRLFAVEVAALEPQSSGQAALRRAVQAYAHETCSRGKRLAEEVPSREARALEASSDRWSVAEVAHEASETLGAGMSPRHAALKRFLEDQQATLLWLFIEQSNLLHAQQLAVDLHEWEAVCEIAYGLDEAFHLLGLHSERVRLNQSARVAASRIGDAEANARASLGQANALRHLGRATEALEVLELARALYGELGDKINQVRTITQMGHVLRESGDLESARDRYSSAMDLLAGQPDLGALSEILSNMANVQKLRGHLDEAEKLSRKAIALLQEIDAPSLRLLQELGWALGGLGAVHNRQGRLKESLEAHEASRRAFALLGNHVGQGYALLNLGRIAFDIGYQSYSQALLNTSLEAFSMAGDAHGRAKSLIALAKVSWRRGAAIDATRYFLLGVKQRHQILSDARQARKYASSDRRALSAGE